MAIAERYDLVIPAAGGPQKKAGDYMYHSGRLSHFGEGMWGLIRVEDELRDGLQPLPMRREIPKSAPGLCPADAPMKHFDVAAIDFSLDFNPNAPDQVPAPTGTNRNLILANPEGKIFALTSEVAALESGRLQPHPLTLRANIGDCIKVTLHNRLKSEKASFHADMLAYDPHDSMGANIGRNKGDQTVSPGGKRTYTFYAHPEFGEATAIVSDYGKVTRNLRDGLYGAIIIGPRGSKYRDTATSEDISLANRWQANVIVDRSIRGNRSRSDYRDVALLFQEEDNLIGTPFMPYISSSAGLSAVKLSNRAHGLARRSLRLSRGRCRSLPRQSSGPCDACDRGSCWYSGANARDRCSRGTELDLQHRGPSVAARARCCGCGDDGSPAVRSN